MPLSASQVTTFAQHAAVPDFPNGSIRAGQYSLIFRIRRRADSVLLKEHSLVLFPATFSQDTESRTSLYYTKGGIVADTPGENGVGATYFQISGHTGYRGVLASPTGAGALPAGTVEAFVQTVQSVVTNFRTGQPPALRGSLIDGAAAVKDLQDTILGYFFPQGQEATRSVTRPQDLALEFLNVSAPISAEDRTGFFGWEIHPHRNLVSLRQDATRPFLYSYQLQFAGLRPLEATITPDDFVNNFTHPRTGLQQTLAQMTKVVRDLTNGVNTIEDAMTQMVIQNVTGPVSTFLSECTHLGDAIGNFIGGTADKIRFPLYAQRTAAHVLDAPKHSVTTLAQASKELGLLLISAADPRSLGHLLAGQEIVPGQNDLLTLALNSEDPQTVLLPGLTGGPAIASSLQSQVRALAPQHAANASAYRDFTATFENGQYQLSSGTKLSDAGSVRVVVPPDPELAHGDASASLGLGVGNGGQEQPGSAYPNPALALLRGVEEACAHLQAFPDFFAEQLDAQDAALAALLPPGVTRPQIRGDQRMQQTRVTPGDSLQGIAARVGVDWQTLALVNRLTYPYILADVTELLRGRVSSADFWTLTDVTQHWAVDAYTGQRLDILAGAGAGQSRRIIRNTATQLVLEHAWDVVPTDISDYAIRSAENPILQHGMVSSATSRSLTDSSLALVPDAQRGLTLLLTSGSSAGERRRITSHDRSTYLVDRPWDALPPAGTLYAVLGPPPATLRQKLVGDLLSVPQPSATTPLPIRTRLQDVSAITGRHLSTEEKLFGRDMLLQDGALVYDAALGDAVTIAELPNLRQALINYINLPLGELEYAPFLGSYVQETLGLYSTLPLQIELLHSVERTIKQDGRIVKLQGAQLVSQGGVVLMSFGATAINGATISKVTIR